MPVGICFAGIFGAIRSTGRRRRHQCWSARYAEPPLVEHSGVNRTKPSDAGARPGSAHSAASNSLLSMVCSAGDAPGPVTAPAGSTAHGRGPLLERVRFDVPCHSDVIDGLSIYGCLAKIAPAPRKSSLIFGVRLKCRPLFSGVFANTFDRGSWIGGGPWGPCRRVPETPLGELLGDGVVDLSEHALVEAMVTARAASYPRRPWFVVSSMAPGSHCRSVRPRDYHPCCTDHHAWRGCAPERH